MIGVTTGKHDEIVETLLQKAPQKVPSKVLAEQVGLSEETVIKFTRDLKEEHGYLSHLLFTKQIDSSISNDDIIQDGSTHLMWIPFEFINQVAQFIEEGGFNKFYDEKFQRIKEGKRKDDEHKELLKRNLEVTTISAQASLKRAHRAEIASWIAIGVSIASALISILK